MLLVLLPGMDGTGRLLERFVAALRPGFQATVVSYPPDQALDYSALEALARSRLPADRPFVVLGESFSGPIALSIAASTPSGLCGVVLCCSFARNPRPGLDPLRTLARVLPIRVIPAACVARALLGRFSTPPLRRVLVEAMGQVAPSVLRARIHAVLGANVSSLLPRVRVPVLYLRASEDRVGPRAASRLILQLLPATKIIDVEAPHCLLQAAPAEAARHIAGFVRELAR